MSPFTRNFAILALFLSLSQTATCAPNTNVEIVQCNVGTYSEGDPFAISLAYVLAELEDATPSRRGGYDFRNVSPYPNAFAYGHAACNRTLASPDCAACLAAAKTSVLGACAGRIGGRSVLYDCTVRYEQYPFDD
ncbi:antifungal protein ginkbilobin-like protein [Henckelia pumila]|uniref:antifungal protein ginkbilobin-like protein n=1 Tax=Henckelia pumila TaxID=405737 RepID=UPI003C6DC532